MEGRGGNTATAELAHSASPPPAVDLEALPEGDRLADWVRERGGYVHPALALCHDTACGSRGIRTREAIAGEEAALPVVVVPEKLYLTARSADAVLSPALRAAGKAPLHERLNSGMQLAVLLAHQRRSDPDDEELTPYAAYVGALPEHPPCPWLLPPQQLAESMASLGLGWAQRRHWTQEVADAARHAAAQAADASRCLAPVYDIDPVDICWGMGQIASRAFGGFADPGMAPYIDLFNHQDLASHPLGVDDEDALPGGPHYCVTSLWDGQPREVEAGAELYISYNVLEHGMTPLNASVPLHRAHHLPPWANVLQCHAFTATSLSWRRCSSWRQALDTSCKHRTTRMP